MLGGGGGGVVPFGFPQPHPNNTSCLTMISSFNFLMLCYHKYFIIDK
jgi:hypothetical protein